MYEGYEELGLKLGHVFVLLDNIFYCWQQNDYNWNLAALHDIFSMYHSHMKNIDASSHFHMYIFIL